MRKFLRVKISLPAATGRESPKKTGAPGRRRPHAIRPLGAAPNLQTVGRTAVPARNAVSSDRSVSGVSLCASFAAETAPDIVSTL